MTKNRDTIALVDRNRPNIVNITRWPEMGNKHGIVEVWATDNNGDLWTLQLNGLALQFYDASNSGKWTKVDMPPWPKP